MDPAHSRRAWRKRFGCVCAALKYAWCEPSAEDLYDDVVVEHDEPSSDGHSDFDHAVDVMAEHQEEEPSPISSLASSQMVARAVAADKHRAARERERLMMKRRPEAKESSSPSAHDEEDVEFDESAISPATMVASLSSEDFSVVNEEKTPMSDAEQRRSSRGRQLSRDRVSGTPPRHATNQSRWSDEILEGFLFSTLVDGSGLVLDKLDSDGKGKKIGERILSYDPEVMKLNWISTGMRRKPGSMLAKDIDEVLCEGTTVTIIYSQATSTGGTVRRMSMSPMRRSSHQTPQTEQGRRRKVFQTSQERDARILAELLLFVRRKTLAAFSVAVSKLAASANAASGSSAAGFGDDDDNGNGNGSDSDSDDGGADSAGTKSRSFGSGRVKLGSTGSLGRIRRRPLL